MEILIQDDKNNSVSLSDFVFNSVLNKGLVHQVITAYLSGSRQGSKSQKSRAEVSGSGRKPWRQKGTGRARVGSIRSPLWRSGGVTFASGSRSYAKKINKKMYKGALKSIFSELIRENRLMIFENFSIPVPKTKALMHQLNKISIKEVFIITDTLNINLYLASRNLHKICVREVRYINPVSLITFNKVLCTTKSIRKIEEMLE